METRRSSFGVAYVLFLLMYMVVLLYGMNVARSIIEEKTSRVFEVLLATIKPDELLAGKILGVGAVGLTQVAIWMVAAGLIAARLGATSGVQISMPQVVYFIVYFALGYALYSCGGGGAGGDDELGAGTAAAEYVPDDAAVFQPADAAADRDESELDAGADRIADSVLRAAADEPAGFDFDAAAVGDCAVDWVDPGDDLRGAVGVVADLSRGHFDVRQEAQSPGDSSLVEVQLGVSMR